MINLYELQEQLEKNICLYVEETNSFNGFGEGDIKDSLCQIVIDTFDKAFFAPAPSEKK